MRWKTLFGRRDEAVERAYKSVMQEALSPVFYREKLSEDTFEGRFAMVAVHGALAMRALRRGGEPGRRLADALYRKIFDGFDYALREEGVGDSSIARKVRGLGEAFFGLAKVMDQALDAAEPVQAVMDVVNRNTMAGAQSDRLAELIVENDKRLTEQKLDTLLSGAFEWAAL